MTRSGTVLIHMYKEAVNQIVHRNYSLFNLF